MQRRAQKRTRTPSPPPASAIHRPSSSRRALIFENLMRQRVRQPSNEAEPRRRHISAFEVTRSPGQSLRMMRSVGIVQTPSGRFHPSSYADEPTGAPRSPWRSGTPPPTAASSADTPGDHPRRSGTPPPTAASSADTPVDSPRGSGTPPPTAARCPVVSPPATLFESDPAALNLLFEQLEEEAGLDEEEVLELSTTQPDHLLRWIDNSAMVRENHPAPEFANVPLLVIQADPLVSAAPVDYDNPTPSTSGLQRSVGPQPPMNPARPSRFEPDGSDLDSDFDDDWDTGVAPEPVINLPNDEDIDDDVLRRRLLELERAMDEAHDRLLSMNVDFNWESDFDRFEGVQERFSGPTPGPINDYETPYDAFVDIWDESIVGNIVVETNRYAEQTINAMTENGTLGPTSRLRKWVETSLGEMYVLFGLFIIMGIAPRAVLKEYWYSKCSFLEMPGFRSIMTYPRYILLNKFLHFVDNSTLQPLPAPRSGLQQSGGRGLDLRLQKLQPIIDWLNAKFSSLYNLLPDISIDESLLLYKGRLSWIQAIRTKAARFGLKSFELCEALTGYLFRFVIYTGSTVNAPSTNDAMADANDLGGKTTKVVQNLMDGLWERGHCLTMDNFYNSPALARYLKIRRTDCLGTLRPNRKHVPAAVRLPSNAPRGQLVSRHSKDVSIITWKDAKPVTLISTFHRDNMFMGTRGGRPCRKPCVVSDYNRRMGGVDTKDQKLSYYLMERKRGLKWYIKMFKRLLNASVHNAWIMYNASRRRRDLPTMSQRDFRYNLADTLICKHKQSELAPRVAADVRTNNKNHLPFHHQGKGCARGRCKFCFCSSGVRKVVSTGCQTCGVFLCFGTCWEQFHSLSTLPERNH